MEDVRYEHVVERLVAVLPEIAQEYEEELAEWPTGQPGPHVIYGSVLSRFMCELEDKVSNDEDSDAKAVLKRACALLEELAGSSDFQTRSVVEASVLESLLGDRGGWDRFSPHFGPRTLGMARRLAERWGQPWFSG